MPLGVDYVSVDGEQISPEPTSVPNVIAENSVTPTIQLPAEPRCIVQPINLFPGPNAFSNMSRKEKSYNLCRLANEAGLKVSEYKKLLKDKDLF